MKANVQLCNTIRAVTLQLNKEKISNLFISTRRDDIKYEEDERIPGYEAIMHV